MFAFLLFFSAGFASQVSEHHVSADIDGGGVVHFEVEVNFVEMNTERVNYLVFARIDDARRRLTGRRYRVSLIVR